MGKKAAVRPAVKNSRELGSSRDGKIDLLKFLFAVTVAIYHFNCSADYKREIFNSSYIAVEFFFIVSGYFMARSLGRFDGRTDIDTVKETLLFVKRKYFSFFRYHVFMFIITVRNCWEIS